MSLQHRAACAPHMPGLRQGLPTYDRNSTERGTPARVARAPDLVAGLLLVAPAIPTNNPEGSSWSRGGSSLGSKLRLGLTRAILQARQPMDDPHV